MTFPPLLVETDDDITTITMRRAARRNALSRDHLHELLAAFRAVGDSDARAVVLTAEGPVFSAGHDFADVAGAGVAAVRDLLQLCTDLMATIQSIPQPVVAAVQGLATAAGCQLVCSCDLAVAAGTAAFAIPGGKGGWFCHTPLVAVSRSIGRKRAVEMAFTGDPVDAATALDWGLVNEVAAPDDLLVAARALAGRASRGSTLSKALGKAGFYAQADLEQADAYERAIELMATSSQLPDAQASMAAFLAKGSRHP